MTGLHEKQGVGWKTLLHVMPKGTDCSDTDAGQTKLSPFHHGVLPNSYLDQDHVLTDADITVFEESPQVMYKQVQNTFNVFSFEATHLKHLNTQNNCLFLEAK